MVMLQGEDDTLTKPEDWEKQKSLKPTTGRTDTKSGSTITPSRKSFCRLSILIVVEWPPDVWAK